MKYTIIRLVNDEFFSNRIKAGIKAAQAGIICNTIMVFIKIITGILGNSYALIADGIESATDVLLSAIVWKGLRFSEKEANEKYHFGYGKAESLSAVVVGLLIIAAGIGISIAAIREILTPHHLPESFTLFVLIGVVITKEILARKISKIGKATESLSVQGDALHHRADALTSLAAFIGILIALIGGPGWESADDYAAVFCAVIIIWNGFNILKSAARELMDRAPSPDFITQITTAASTVKEAILVEKVFCRKAGVAYFVALHVHADPTMSLHDAHIVSGKVKTAVKRALPAVKDVLVHMEPAE